MSDLTRVMVTGVGAVSASGMNIEAMWDAMLAGNTGIDEIKNADISSWSHRLGGEIKDYKPAKMLPERKLLKAISRQDVLGISAAMQAIEDSQILPYRDGLDNPTVFNEKTGVFVGSPGNKYYQQYDFLPLMAKTQNNMQAFGSELMNDVHPMWLLRILPNNVLAYTGITYGFKGVNHNVVNHATGGMQALLEAYHAIQAGQADRIVVVAYDVGTDLQASFYYERLGLLSAQHLKPFDRAHDGTILAEGAAALVLESEASAKARGATTYAELTGGFARTEGSGLFSIEASGDALTEVLYQTLATQHITADDLAFIVAHGNGNPKSDISEAHAINRIQGEARVPVTGFKWAMGHTLCSSGLMDAALAAKALKTRTLPGIANLDTPAKACEDLNLLTKSQELDNQAKHALLINRGFGSMNVAVTMKACDHT